MVVRNEVIILKATHSSKSLFVNNVTNTYHNNNIKKRNLLGLLLVYFVDLYVIKFTF
jgi:hypothetical protein